jgi:serine/threonine protein kinase
MDWGLSKLLDSLDHAASIEDSGTGSAPAARGSGHGTVLGTPGYMAPEQRRGDESLDRRADIYSLGAVLQFLLADVSARRATRPLAAICRRAMAAERSERYQTVPELSSEVAHFLDGVAVVAYPEGPLARAWRWFARNRVWILLLLAYVVTRTLLIIFRPR